LRRAAKTITVFGTPLDVTLSELTIETCSPADSRAEEIFRPMGQAQTVVLKALSPFSLLRQRQSPRTDKVARRSAGYEPPLRAWTSLPSIVALLT
jgi:hypothetical protein